MRAANMLSKTDLEYAYNEYYLDRIEYRERGDNHATKQNYRVYLTL